MKTKYHNSMELIYEIILFLAFLYFVHKIWEFWNTYLEFKILNLFVVFFARKCFSNKKSHKNKLNFPTNIKFKLFKNVLFKLILQV